MRGALVTTRGDGARGVLVPDALLGPVSNCLGTFLRFLLAPGSRLLRFFVKTIHKIWSHPSHKRRPTFGQNDQQPLYLSLLPHPQKCLALLLTAAVISTSLQTLLTKVGLPLLRRQNFSTNLVPVNVMKGKIWNEKSEFDEAVDKTQFRDYESACDRVKNFYKEQHG